MKIRRSLDSRDRDDSITPLALLFSSKQQKRRRKTGEDESYEYHCSLLPHLSKILTYDVSAEPGVLSRLSMPLADRQISIFQFSTYESDFTLVPEDRLQDAMDILKPLFTITSRSYTILRETSHSTTKQPPTTTYSDIDTPSSSLPLSSSPSSTASFSSFRGAKPNPPMSPPPRRHPFTVTSYRVYLTSIDKHLLKNITHTLLELLFFSKR
jgi:hypothetical protein